MPVRTLDLKKASFCGSIERMKTLAFVLVSAAAVLALSSCGECNCNSYNPALLRDVPVSSSRVFDNCLVWDLVIAIHLIFHF